MDQLQWQMIATALGLAAASFVGQLAKSYKQIPTAAPQFAMWIVGVVIYLAWNPPKRDGWLLVQDLLVAAFSALSVNGGASMIGLHPSMATDSKDSIHTEVPK